MFYLMLPTEVVLLLALALSYLIACIVIPVVIRVAREKHLMNEPNGRSSHTQKTPSLGGVAIFVALATVFAIMTPLALRQETSTPLILPSLVILFFIGLKDDILVIDPYKKLVAQALAATLLILFTDIRVGSLFGLFGITQLPYLMSFGLTLFVMIAIINAYNLIDGIDGLAGGLGVVACLTLGIYFYIAGILWATVLCATLIGALTGFIRFNFSTTRKVFMGDSGSLTVGFVLAMLAIKFLQVNEIAHPMGYVKNAPGLAIAILFIPLFDTLRVFIHRIMSGKAPFHADRNHIHHFVVDSGFSHKQTSIILCSANAMIIGLGFFAFAQTSVVTSLLFLCVLFVTYAIVVRRKKPDTRYSQYYVRKRVVAKKLQQEPVN